MTILERLRAFFFAKRRWQWVLVGVTIVAVGHYLDARKIEIEPKSLVESGKRLTERLHDRLALAQPQTIAALYGRAGAGRHGIGLCGQTAALEPLRLNPDHLKRHAMRPPAPPGWRTHQAPATPIDDAIAPLERDAGLPTPHPTIDLAAILRQERITHPAPMPGTGGDPFANMAGSYSLRHDPPGPSPATLPPPPPPKGTWHCSDGWMRTADSAALTLRVTPEVGYAVWAEGGWSATILFALTILAMATALVSLWSTKDMGCAVFPATLIILSAGPFIAGGIFWLMLWVLLALTAALGKVLAGLAIVVGWIAAGWKMAKFVVESLTTGDETHENIKSLKASFGGEPPPAD